MRVKVIGLRAALAAAVSLGVAACGSIPGGEANFPEKRKGDTAPTWSKDAPRETVFGTDGLNLFGGGKKKAEDGGGGGIGVNAYLWRASLDTVAFMPISSADPFGGVILTDWYAPPETPSERFKLTVFIMDRALRADGVRVAVFRQVRDGAGNWIDAAVDGATGTAMEDAILTRARQLRIGGSGVAK